MNAEVRYLSPLPAGLPWTEGASLLLDGASLAELPQWLRQWSGTATFQPLYAQTRWDELVDISPCLVQLNGPNDALLDAFLAQGQGDWGYLLFGQAPWHERLAHLRWLLNARHPRGEEMLLRLADPAVANALLGRAVANGDACLFGPFESILAFDGETRSWLCHRRPAGPVPARQDGPYRLDDEELERLGEVRWQRVVEQLDAHLRQAFPHYAADCDRSARRAHLRGLAEQAHARGLCSEIDIARYANLFGLLGEQALQDYPEIAALLDTTSSQTPSRRLEAAADLAYAIALQARSAS